MVQAASVMAAAAARRIQILPMGVLRSGALLEADGMGVSVVVRALGGGCVVEGCWLCARWVLKERVGEQMLLERGFGGFVEVWDGAEGRVSALVVGSGGVGVWLVSHARARARASLWRVS